MRYNIPTYFAILIFGILAGHAHAEPTIQVSSGEFSHGGSVAVSGSEFGTRGNYNNTDSLWRGHDFLAFRVKDFDDGSLSSGGFNNPNSSWLLSDGGRQSDGYFATKYYNGQRLGALSATQRGTTGNWYVSFWFKLPANTSSSKPFRLYGSGLARNLYIATGGANSGWDFSLRGYSECAASECSVETVWSSPDKMRADTWHRIEIIMSQTDSGSITVLLDGIQQWRRENWLATSTGIYNGHTIDLGNMINAAAEGGNSFTNNSYNFDDVYLDFTQARVEIGNAPTWSSTTYREVQIPTSWSNGMINFAVNAGQFTEGQTAYLYVIDSDGRANSNGFPIVIGANGTTQAGPQPNAPVGLSAL